MGYLEKNGLPSKAHSISLPTQVVVERGRIHKLIFHMC